MLTDEVVGWRVGTCVGLAVGDPVGGKVGVFGATTGFPDGSFVVGIYVGYLVGTSMFSVSTGDPERDAVVGDVEGGVVPVVISLVAPMANDPHA